jgi:hypothetical protein
LQSDRSEQHSVVSCSSSKALAAPSPAVPSTKPPISDDRDGHLIYQAGDIILNRCKPYDFTDSRSRRRDRADIG